MTSPRAARPALGASALILLGRGALGALPAVLVSIAARRDGLEAAGRLSVILALSLAVAEVGDLASQRHLPRISLGPQAGERGSTREPRIAAYHGVRFLLLAAGLAVGAAVVASSAAEGQVGVELAILAVAIPSFLCNGAYAAALVAGRYGVLGLAPVAMTLLALGSYAALRGRSALPPLAAAALALLVARGAEAGLLETTLALPRPRFERALLHAAFGETAALLGLLLLSVAHARLVIPLAGFLASPSDAGAFALGLFWLGLFALGGTAVALPAYRRLALSGAPRSLREALAQTRGELALGVVAAVVAIPVLLAAGPLLSRFLLRRQDVGAAGLLTPVLLCGVFEIVAVLIGLLYQACGRDRDLLVRSFLSVVCTWSGMAAGHRLGGGAGMAWGYFAGRAAGLVTLAAPFPGALGRAGRSK